MKKKLKEKCESLFENGEQLLLLSYSGSKLHGTNTESSDLDIKGVFLPKISDRLNRIDKKVIKFSTGNEFSKNSSEDLDIELFNMFDFMDMLIINDTTAVELFFSIYNSNMVLFENILFVKILRIYRELLISNNVAKMTGFALKISNQFVIKAERLIELEEVLKFFRECDEKQTLEDCSLDLELMLNNHEHNYYDETYFVFLNRKFTRNLKIKEVKKRLNIIKSKYGQRVKDIDSSNIDYKALSHALRAFQEAVYILEDQFITLPLPTAKELLQIKKGDYDIQKVNKEIERLSIKIDNLILEKGVIDLTDNKLMVLDILISELYGINEDKYFYSN